MYFNWKEDWPMVICTIGIIAIIIGMVYLAIQDEKQWQQFKVDHNCKIVGESQSSGSYGLSSSGKMIWMTNPGSKTWLCDDGIQYTRSE